MGIDQALRSILETTSEDYGHAVRSVHAKSHGLLDGTLAIFDDLPATPRGSRHGAAAIPS